MFQLPVHFPRERICGTCSRTQRDPTQGPRYKRNLSSTPSQAIPDLDGKRDHRSNILARSFLRHTAQKTPILRVIFLHIQMIAQSTTRVTVFGFKSNNIYFSLNDLSLNSGVCNSRPIFPPGPCPCLFVQQKT